MSEKKIKIVAHEKFKLDVVNKKNCSGTLCKKTFKLCEEKTLSCVRKNFKLCKKKIKVV